MTSIGTSFTLGCHVQSIGENAQDAINILYKDLCGANIEKPSYVPNLLACDRGYTNNELIEKVIAMGGDAICTRKRIGAPYTFGMNRIGSNQTSLDIQGAKVFRRFRPIKNSKSGYRP